MVKIGRLYEYGSAVVGRQKATIYKPAFYALFPESGLKRFSFRTERETKAFIDAIDRLACERVDGAVRAERMAARKRAARRVSRVVEPGQQLTYRDVSIERVVDDRGRQCFHVPGMGRRFRTLEAALQRINWRASQFDYIERGPDPEPNGMKRNLQK